MELCCSEDVDLKYDHSLLHLYYIDLVGTRYVRNTLFSRYHLLSKYIADFVASIQYDYHPMLV
jgi:hypothetical protein